MSSAFSRNKSQVGNIYNFKTMDSTHLASKTDNFIKRMVERNQITASNRNDKLARVGKFETICQREARKMDYITENVKVGYDTPQLASHYTAIHHPMPLDQRSKSLGKLHQIDNFKLTDKQNPNRIDPTGISMTH
jgi:hypothetical protein